MTYSSLLTIRKIHAHLAIMQLFFIVLLTSVSARSPPSIPIIERQRPHDYDSTDALKTSIFRCALPIKCPSSTSSNDPNPNGPPSPLQSLPVAAPFTDDSSPSDRVSWDSEAYKHMCRRFPPFQAKFHLILKPSQSIHPPITKPTSSAASIFLLSLNKDDVNTSAAYCGEYEPLIPVRFNGSRQSDPIPAPNLRHSQHSISDLANHSQDTHAYFRPHLLPSTIHQFHGIFTQPFCSRIDIRMIQLSFLVSRFTRFTDRFDVSFALYFQNSTNQAKFIRDIYSYDRNPFCFLPATIHFNTDPDFSFSALCTIQPYLLCEFLQQHFRSDIKMSPAFHASHDSTRHQATSKLEQNSGFRSKISLELSYFALSRSQHYQADDRPRLLQAFCHQQSPTNLPVHCTIYFVFYHAQRSLHSGDKDQMLVGISDQQCSLYSGDKDQMLVGISDQHVSLYSGNKDQMLVGISDQHVSAVGDTDQHISSVGVQDQHAHVFSSILWSFQPSSNWSLPSVHHLQSSFSPASSKFLQSVIFKVPSIREAIYIFRKAIHIFQHQSTSSYQSSQQHPTNRVNSIRPINPTNQVINIRPIKSTSSCKQAHNSFHSLPVWGDCKMPHIRTQSAHDLVKYIRFSPFRLV